jgi:hypothetical protein
LLAGILPDVSLEIHHVRGSTKLSHEQKLYGSRGGA